jgi:hypothetical protein
MPSKADDGGSGGSAALRAENAALRDEVQSLRAMLEGEPPAPSGDALGRRSRLLHAMNLQLQRQVS